MFFSLIDVNGQIRQTKVVTTAPFEAAMDVGLLSPSLGNTHPKIQVIPYVNGQPDCATSYPVHVMADPLAFPAVKPLNGGTLWNGRRYEFTGFIPKATDVQFFLPPEALDYFGQFDNRFRAGVLFGGVIYETGQVDITLLRAEVLARALNVDLYNKQRQLDIPAGVTSNPWQYLRAVKINLGTFDLVAEDYAGLPFLHVPVLDLFGLIQVHVASSGGVTYGIKLSGTVKPFVPGVEAKITASVGAQAEIGYGLGIIGGVAAVGYTMGLGAAMDSACGHHGAPPTGPHRTQGLLSHQRLRPGLGAIPVGHQTARRGYQSFLETGAGRAIRWAVLGPFAEPDEAAAELEHGRRRAAPCHAFRLTLGWQPAPMAGCWLPTSRTAPRPSGTSQVRIMARFQDAAGQWSAPAALIASRPQRRQPGGPLCRARRAARGRLGGDALRRGHSHGAGQRHQRPSQPPGDFLRRLRERRLGHADSPDR